MARPPNCNSFLSEGSEGWYADMPSYDYNPEKSIALLEKAGISSGELTIDFSYPTTSVGENLAAALKEEFDSIGVNLNPVPLEPSAWTSATFSGDFEAVYNNWQDIPYNPPLVYNLFLLSKGVLCFCKNNDPRIDELCALGSAELDDATRIGYYEEIMSIVQGDCYYIPIAYQKDNIAVRDEMNGIKFEPNTGLYRICDWYSGS